MELFLQTETWIALSFLMLIGFMLLVEGLHFEVPKGYIYFAVFFSLAVEIKNITIFTGILKQNTEVWSL